MRRLRCRPQRMWCWCAASSASAVHTSIHPTVHEITLPQAVGEWVSLQINARSWKLDLGMQIHASCGKVERAMMWAQVDSDWDAIAQEPACSPPARARPDSMCYIIFTSGSTGRPKGTVLQHNSIINYLLGMVECESPLIPLALFALGLCVGRCRRGRCFAYCVGHWSIR